MTIQIELPPDLAARYAAEAEAKGVPLESHVVERLIADARGASAPPLARPLRPLKLPLLKGRLIGSVRRQDIYDALG